MHGLIPLKIVFYKKNLKILNKTRFNQPPDPTAIKPNAMNAISDELPTNLIL